MSRFPRASRRRASAGFTLIELMVALLLGLLVMGAAIGIFLSNRQAYSATENLGRVQEHVRFAFELMAYDIRRAGANPCGNHIPTVNVVTNSSGHWWTDLNSFQSGSGELVNPWRNTLVTYAGSTMVPGMAFGSGAGQRVNGTEAIQILAAGEPVFSVQAHDPAGTTFTLNSAGHDFQPGNIMIACDARQAAVFQASAAGADTVQHAQGGAADNCTSKLGLPADCAAATDYTFQPNAMLARLDGVRWYVGNNGRGGQSLYYTRVDADGAGVSSEEVVEGVDRLDFELLLEGAASYVSSSAVPVTEWANVSAIRVNLGLTATDTAGSTGNTAIRRTLSHVVSLRSRNP